jgi:alkanesulfonate monooxygenase SsuD/methylene tetrahydromethanopterin reductase-like flavin-dependent oxidoreductase (luciferase family)
MCSMSTPMRRPGIGLNLPTWPRGDRTHASWREMRSLARDAEALGVDMLWVPDHLMRVLPSGRWVGFRECWTILTAVAEATTRIGIGPFVACTGYRNPGLLARMAETLDEVSEGRLVLGLGSGSPDTDTSWRAFGFDAARPVGRFAESAEVVARLLRGETVTFSGEHVRTEGATLEPRGPRPAGLPLWLAAKGERTMDVAARWGDTVNVNTPLASSEDVAAAASASAAACARVGRDPSTLPLTGWARIALDAGGRGVARPGWLAGSPADLAATLGAMAGAGLAHVSVYIGLEDDSSPLPALTQQALERFAPVLEALGAS